MMLSALALPATIASLLHTAQSAHTWSRFELRPSYSRVHGPGVNTFVRRGMCRSDRFAPSTCCWR